MLLMLWNLPTIKTVCKYPIFVKLRVCVYRKMYERVVPRLLIVFNLEFGVGKTAWRGCKIAVT